jgi:predicted DCC family thiol-disulfide oxidoreductase YuxK
MKKLAHKIIIYDDVCPMCKAYTEGFVHLGWLPLENRVGFSEVPQTILDKIDSDRARHEIPLFDTETGETLYGKDALFYILGEQIAFSIPAFQSDNFLFLSNHYLQSAHHCEQSDA